MTSLITINKSGGVVSNPEERDAQFYRLMFFFIIFCALLYCFCVTFMPITKDNQQYANTILGFLLGSGLATLIGWRWGSSKSSQDKTTQKAKDDTAVIQAITAKVTNTQ